MIVIGCGGQARAGKDTFVGIAIDILKANGYRPIRVAFADKLKNEVQDMLNTSRFDLDIFKLSAEEKERVRPLFVFWGCQRRYESKGGMYWVNEVDNQLSEICVDYLKHGESHESLVALVSDVRFPNEAKWIHEKWNGSIVHIKRWKTESHKCGQDGSDSCVVKVFDPAPNEEEAKQDPLVEAVADVKVEWENQQESTTLAAIKNQKLKEVVWDALNHTKYFKLSRPIIGTLTL
jgi:hypothetical protein